VPAAAASAAVAADREPELPLPLEEAILFFLCSVRQEPPFLARKKNRAALCFLISSSSLDYYTRSH